MYLKFEFDDKSFHTKNDSEQKRSVSGLQSIVLYVSISIYSIIQVYSVLYFLVVIGHIRQVKLIFAKNIEFEI